MVGNKPSNFNNDDPFDINELAGLNEDFSAEFIEQLQNQISANTSQTSGAAVSNEDDSTLFEEVEEESASDNNIKPTPRSSKINISDNIDDNFIKKYKAKLQKQAITGDTSGNSNNDNASETINSNIDAAFLNENSIEVLSKGNISEKPATKEQIEYNDTLDLLDDNIKYSKYVIYIDPENEEFIDSLTVKERKNLINRIIREQDDISMTRRRLNSIQTLIKHSIVAIITISISIPIIYFIVNASLEASINNYRRSQAMFKTLYKEKGKIKAYKNH